MRYFMVIIAGIALWMQGSGISRVDTSKTDSLKQKDSVEALRPHFVEQPIKFPGVGTRMAYLAVGVVTVGGLAVLLNRKRRRIDKRLEERHA